MTRGLSDKTKSTSEPHKYRGLSDGLRFPNTRDLSDEFSTDS